LSGEHQETRVGHMKVDIIRK